MGCALSKNEINRSYLSENVNVNVNGSTYKRMLRNFLILGLQDYSDNVIFQQDGVPSHYSCEIQ